MGNAWDLPALDGKDYCDDPSTKIIHQTTSKVSGNTEIPQFNTAMSVPDAYFDQLHDNILAKVRALSTNNAPAESQQHGKDEELADYPQLQSLHQSHTFAVPGQLLWNKPRKYYPTIDPKTTRAVNPNATMVV